MSSWSSHVTVREEPRLRRAGEQSGFADRKKKRIKESRAHGAEE